MVNNSTVNNIILLKYRMGFINDILSIIIKFCDFDELMLIRKINHEFSREVYNHGSCIKCIETVFEGELLESIMKNIKLDLCINIADAGDWYIPTIDFIDKEKLVNLNIINLSIRTSFYDDNYPLEFNYVNYIKNNKKLIILDISDYRHIHDKDIQKLIHLETIYINENITLFGVCKMKKLKHIILPYFEESNTPLTVWRDKLKHVSIYKNNKDFELSSKIY
jgi:hypothetical protein